MRRSICSSFAWCNAPGTLFVETGASPNNAVRGRSDGDDVVKLSTIDRAGSEGFRGVRPESLFVSGESNDRWSLGVSGENEGNDVKDLSDGAREDADDEVYDEQFLGFRGTEDF